jgi:hypothetical protein
LCGVVLVAAAIVPVVTTGAAATSPPVCDPIDAGQCLMPFPNNFYTVKDTASPTGLRVHFNVAAMPKNGAGVPINPTDWNRLDGFSPGAEILVQATGIDLAKTGVATISDIGTSLSAGAPIVLYDLTSKQRVPYWAELDTWNPDDPLRALVIRPARNFVEGDRIVVALRNLKDANGNLLPAPANFALVRDNKPVTDPALLARKPSLQQVLLNELPAAGVGRGPTLFLAWDFTVASEQGLSGAMLHMRDDAYAQLGGAPPVVHVTSVDNNVSDDWLRRVQGTFDVPNYLRQFAQPGTRLNLGSNGLPVRRGTYGAQFRCLIPRSVVDASGHVHPARGVVYGHGLLGNTDEIEGYGQFANQYNMVICATPFIGMSDEDLGNVFKVLQDLSTFGSIPDRLQQGFLHFEFLAQEIKDQRGFAAQPAFQVGTPAHSVFAPQQVFYNGNSQGGIFGGTVTAISKQWTRAVLGVPGMNYSTLLPRSVDFDEFQTIMNASYPNKKWHTLSVALIQMLWDHADADGYAQHMTDHPYPGTPRHQVLMIEAFGDHQVANIATETEARTIGAVLRTPALAPGRSPIEQQFWNLAPLARSPYRRSVLEVWDFGTPAPPLLSLPPESPQYGSDPHGAARNVAAVRDQVSRFLKVGGEFVDECGTDPCHP